MLTTYQHTLASAISCTGKGLHTGKDVHVRLLPAAVDSGIVFRRTDLAGKPEISAAYDRVTDTRFCTTITDGDVSVATIEHLMAAFAGLGVDNAVVELDAPEVPIMDGSSEPFVFLIECAGVKKQGALREYIRVLQPVQLHVNGSWIEVEPAETPILDMMIDFANPVIGRQHLVVDFGQSHFKNTISRARTFGFEQDVAKLREVGLALGGSLDNAIVVGDKAVLNREGLRYADEFVRHKTLDCLGDLYLAGAPILGRVRGFRMGHGINNMLLHAMLDGEGVVERVTLENRTEVPSDLPVMTASIPAGGSSLTI
ncbi:UDP-3-O-acyl-N-acetylglucosamine deacetylase [bacterium]|nr:UDP-3-O-acyl-N-acetylglucosamine deacetylase [bacterium]